jgi:hypothetical protein
MGLGAPRVPAPVRSTYRRQARVLYDVPMVAKRIICAIRMIEVANTPEEMVRQAVVGWLFAHRGYQPDDMAAEFAFKTWKRSGGDRADIVIFRRKFSGEERRLARNISIVIECKRADVSGAAFDLAAEQAKSYLDHADNGALYVAYAGEGRCLVKRRFMRELDHGHRERDYVTLGHSLELLPHAEASAPTGHTVFASSTRAAALGLSTPAETAAPQAMRWNAAPALTLEQHAALTAELAKWPSQEREVLARFHMTVAQRIHADHYYGVRMACDPQQKQAWDRAKAAHATWLATR